MLAVGFLYMAFIMLRKLSSIPSLVHVFLFERLLHFVKHFFLYQLSLINTRFKDYVL